MQGIRVHDGAWGQGEAEDVAEDEVWGQEPAREQAQEPVAAEGQAREESAPDKGQVPGKAPGQESVVSKAEG